jgi:hypothetical protein
VRVRVRKKGEMRTNGVEKEGKEGQAELKKAKKSI